MCRPKTPWAMARVVLFELARGASIDDAATVAGVSPDNPEWFVLGVSDTALANWVRADREARGMKELLSCLSEARTRILFAAVGAERACYEVALSYILERERFIDPSRAFRSPNASSSRWWC